MATSSVEQVARMPRDRGGLAAWVSFPGLASLGVGAALYAWSLHTGRKTYDLEHVRSVVRLEDLKALASLVPVLVAIRGRVNSHAPKKCELCDKQAVIHEVVEEEVWRKQRAEGRTVYEPFETRKVFEECEWFLEDGSGLQVRVENALQADRLRSAMMTKTDFVGEDLTRSTLTKVLIEKAWQMTKHGMRKTERYLPVGAVVTCIGELDTNHIRAPAAASSSSSSSSLSSRGGSSSSSSTLASSTGSTGSRLAEASSGLSSTDNMPGSTGDSGSAGGGVLGILAGPLSSLGKALPGVNQEMPFVLRKPAAGPSYITPLTLDQLKSSMSSTARNCRWLAYAFGTAGVALLLHKAVRHWLQRLRERRIRLRVAQAEAARKARQAEQRKARLAAAEALALLQGGPQQQSQQQGQGQAAVDGGGDVTDSDSYQGDRAAGTCVICLEDSVDMVFTGCGHMCCCMSCGIGLDRCPICRIKGRAIKVYKP